MSFGKPHVRSKIALSKRIDEILLEKRGEARPRYGEKPKDSPCDSHDVPGEIDSRAALELLELGRVRVRVNQAF
jgi:hypothetical protein